MNAQEIRNMTEKELDEKLRESKTELFNLRFQHAAGQLENTYRIVVVKRDIARIFTVAAEREYSLKSEVKSQKPKIETQKLKTEDKKTTTSGKQAKEQEAKKDKKDKRVEKKQDKKEETKKKIKTKTVGKEKKKKKKTKKVKD